MLRRSPLLVMLLLGCSDARPKRDPLALNTLSEVASVALPLDAPDPELTVIHLLDWHYIPRDLYEAELRTRAGEVGEEQIESRYQRFVHEVAAVKGDQTAVLRHLERHGVRAVYQEGLTPEEALSFAETSRSVAAIDRETLVDSVKRSERLLEDPNATNEAAELHAIAMLALEQYDADELTVGAAGVLFADGSLIEVRPLEESEELTAADPRRMDGTAALDEAGQQRRDEAIVRRLLACPEPVAVVTIRVEHKALSSLLYDAAADHAGSSFPDVRVMLGRSGSALL